MKARIPRLSNNEKKRMKSEIKFEVEKIWDEMEQKKEDDLTRRILKTFIYVLHEKYGYGIKRLSALVKEFTSMLEHSSEDNVYWEHIDKVVIDELKIPFKRDYTDRGKAVTYED